VGTPHGERRKKVLPALLPDGKKKKTVSAFFPREKRKKKKVETGARVSVRAGNPKKGGGRSSIICNGKTKKRRNCHPVSLTGGMNRKLYRLDRTQQ